MSKFEERCITAPPPSPPQSRQRQPRIKILYTEHIIYGNTLLHIPACILKSHAFIQIVINLKVSRG